MNDESFLAKFALVLNEMALSSEYWMREIFGDMAEGLAHDEAFLATLRPRLNAKVREAIAASIRR